MRGDLPLRRRSARQVLGVVGLLLVIAGLLGMAPARVEDPWQEGRWRVVARGLDWPARLRRLEIRRTNALNAQPIVVAYTSDAAGQERLWGSARLDRRGLEAGSVRVEWVDGGDTVVLQLRAVEDGRLSAVVRQRERVRGAAAAPERIQQVWLEPEDERPVGLEPRPPAAKPAGGGIGRASEGTTLFTARLDGTGLRAVAPPDGFARAGYPAWSPDGRRIAFTSFDAAGRDPLIRLVDAEGGPSVAVAAGIAPRFSHDGRSLVYVASGRPDYATDWGSPGRNEERIELVHLSGPAAGSVHVLDRGLWPRWAPGDARLAFAAYVGSTWDIYVRSADGSALTRLTDDPSTDTYPIWRPDGGAILFLSNRNNRWDLWQVPADGGAPATRVSNTRFREEGADLSPDGRTVAFTDGLGRRDSQVRLLDLPSGTVRPLLGEPQGDRDPAFSPDGRTIAFVSRRPGPLLPEAPLEPEPTRPRP